MAACVRHVSAQPVLLPFTNHMQRAQTCDGPLVPPDMHAAGQQVTCKHGELECAGNKQLLCVQDKSPGVEDYESFWPFLMCLNSDPANVGQLPHAEECLKGLSKVIGDEARACYNGCVFVL